MFNQLLSNYNRIRDAIFLYWTQLKLQCILINNARTRPQQKYKKTFKDVWQSAKKEHEEHKHMRKQAWLRQEALKERYIYVIFAKLEYYYELIHKFNAKKWVKIPYLRVAYVLSNKYIVTNFTKPYIAVFPVHKTSSSKLLIHIFTFFKKTLLSLLFSVFIVIFFFYLFQISFLKYTAGWLIFGLIGYWLISGFNFFLKRYRFSKYTTAIQRFWKRTLIIFWISEGFLFSLFLYYALNSSQEPTFMYDQISLFNVNLVQLDGFFISSVYVVTALYIIMLSLLRIKFLTFRQLIPYLLIISLILVFLLFNESYQFYYITNFYDDSFWVFSEEDNLWELEHDSPRTRNSNHYVTMIILLKFWHYIFIFGSWVFFLMKTFEQGRVRYALFSMNYQNLIFFYLMSWAVMYTWFKFVYRRFLDKSYFWFFVNNRTNLSTLIAEDFVQYLQSYTNIFTISNYFSFNKQSILPFFKLNPTPGIIWDRSDLLYNYMFELLTQ